MGPEHLLIRNQAMSSIKERVLTIAESKGISKVAFFKALGLSYANFKGVQKQSALGSDAIHTILERFDDVSAEWLVLGRGSMWKDQGTPSEQVAITLPSRIDRVVDTDALSVALEKVVVAQQVTIQSQEVAIAALSARLHQLEKKKKRKKSG